MTDKGFDMNGKPLLPVSWNDLYDVSVELVDKILEDGFVPDMVVALWRGGSTPGLSVHEIFKRIGHMVDHIAVRTERYDEQNNPLDTVMVYGLNFVFNRVKSTSNVLIVDDIWDEGYSIVGVRDRIFNKMGENAPNVKMATGYFKPEKNKFDFGPDYFAREVHPMDGKDVWVDFPHELMGLSKEYIEKKHTGVAALLKKYDAFD